MSRSDFVLHWAGFVMLMIWATVVILVVLHVIDSARKDRADGFGHRIDPRNRHFGGV